jgi:hypothetical protein
MIKQHFMLFKHIAYFIVFWGLLNTPSYGQEKKYHGAEIRTSETFLYGKFEVKMRSVENSGMLSSFFTFYDNPDFAHNWNEIDIEILGRYNNEVQFNIITPGPDGRVAHEKRHVLDFNPHEDYHTYAFVWTPEYISFEVNHREVYRDNGPHIKDMNKPQKLMMNIWISHWDEWTGPWKEGKLPLEASYDYVKYYAYTPQKSDSLTLKWEDHFNKWDFSRWQFASHTFEGNLVQFNEDNKSFKDGKLGLKITKANNLLVQEKPAENQKPELILESGYIKKNRIHLFFSNKLDKKSGKDIANYLVDGQVIEKVRLFINYESNKEEVIIHLPKDASISTPLQIEVKNLVDIHGKQLPEATISVDKK